MGRKSGYKTLYWCSFTTGASLILGSVIHFISISNTIIAIKSGDISPSYASTAFCAWMLAGVGMLYTGIFLLYLARQVNYGSRQHWRLIIFIGTGLCVFGGGCWIMYPQEMHLLYFFILGSILAIPAILYHRQFDKEPYHDPEKFTN